MLYTNVLIDNYTLLFNNHYVYTTLHSNINTLYQTDFLFVSSFSTLLVWSNSGRALVQLPFFGTLILLSKFSFETVELADCVVTLFVDPAHCLILEKDARMDHLNPFRDDSHTSLNNIIIYHTNIIQNNPFESIPRLFWQKFIVIKIE